MSLDSDIADAISQSTGQQAVFKQAAYIAGGSINSSRRVELEDGRQFFIKTHPQSHHYPGMYESEYLGLELLALPGVIHVPEPVCYSESYIVMEYIEEGEAKADWHELMGNQLASLHHATKQDSHGFIRDNYLGTTVQLNDWTDSWLEFWRDRRLGWQLDLLRAKTNSNDPLLSYGEKLLNRLDDYLGHISEPAVLLHGDLWSGNAGSNRKGQPVIFDPACYYGHREAEIGMMRLFGGFGERCEQAYKEVWPFEKGHDTRIKVYKLYHEMNHLILFGRSYYQGCLDTLKRLV